MARILITGGTGLIGGKLASILKQNGHEIGVLSRTEKKNNRFKYFTWDIQNSYVDPEAISFADVIIHLAGAGIADSRWTAKRREQIISSRVDSAKLLQSECLNQDKQLDAFISSSAIGAYGAVTQANTFIETDAYGNDFIAKVCKEWEEAALDFKQCAKRVAIIRTGIVLDADGGALPKMAFPAKFGLAAALGSGKQAMPWIHIDDVCGIYQFAVESELEGAFNAVAPENINNRQFTKLLSNVLHRPFWLPAIPEVLLKLAFGEMASVILEGSPVVPKKIINKGYSFKFENLEQALTEIYRA